jgi:hypothetical protein
MSRIKRNPITGDLETREDYQIGSTRLRKKKSKFKTIKNDKEIR